MFDKHKTKATIVFSLGKAIKIKQTVRRFELKQLSAVLSNKVGLQNYLQNLER